MCKILVFFICLSVNVQAATLDCVKALSQTSSDVSDVWVLDQKTADMLKEEIIWGHVPVHLPSRHLYVYVLKEAIIRGDVKKIENLAKSWLRQKDHEYMYDYMSDTNEGFLKTNDILLFAALITASQLYSTHTIDSLKTLVKMGFGISIENAVDRDKWIDFYWNNFGKASYINPRQEQLLNILLKAGLTAEKLYQTDGDSPVHQSLLIDHRSDQDIQDKFEIIVNSGLITKDNINLAFYPRDYNYERSDKKYPHDVKTTLLHWNAAWSTASATKLLIEKGADLDVTVDITDKDNVYAPTGTTPLKAAQIAKNYYAVIELLEAEANTDGFDINAQIGEFYHRPLLSWAVDREIIFKSREFKSSGINIEPIEKLIKLGASPFVPDEFGKRVVDLIETQVDNLNKMVAELKDRLEKQVDNLNETLDEISKRLEINLDRKKEMLDYMPRHTLTIEEMRTEISEKKYALREYQKSLEVIKNLASPFTTL